MYNPSRGGVRGGADQFTWDSVKNDKHRENYLGHSLMAPVGRWQKGKDLSWYAKERQGKNAPNKSEKSELASIKRAEEEAMLIALGHNIVRKTEALSKEDIREALKRNQGERDEHDIERVDGVGAGSQRVALLSGVAKNFKEKSEGVAFEGRKTQNNYEIDKSEAADNSLEDYRKQSKKKSKKHKKEKKRHHKKSHDSESSESSSRNRTKRNESESDFNKRESLEVRKHKKCKHRHRNDSSDDNKSYNSDSSKIKLGTTRPKHSEGDSKYRKSSKVGKHKKSKYKDTSNELEDYESARTKNQSYSKRKRMYDTSESD